VKELHEETEEDRVNFRELKRGYRLSELLCNWYWVIWAVLMCKDPNKSFGYLEFASHRFQIYEKLLATLISEYKLKEFSQEDLKFQEKIIEKML